MRLGQELGHETLYGQATTSFRVTRHLYKATCVSDRRYRSPLRRVEPLLLSLNLSIHPLSFSSRARRAEILTMRVRVSARVGVRDMRTCPNHHSQSCASSEAHTELHSDRLQWRRASRLWSTNDGGSRSLHASVVTRPPRLWLGCRPSTPRGAGQARRRVGSDKDIMAVSPTSLVGRSAPTVHPSILMFVASHFIQRWGYDAQKVVYKRVGARRDHCLYSYSHC